jgi:ATP-dependent protease HslVU (ClpYQ) peptidase subunit
MTIIVGIQSEGKVWIGGDSQGSAGWEKTQRADEKVFVAHGIAYGFTTSYRMGQILRYHAEEVLSTCRKDDTMRYVVTCLVPMWRRILTENGFTKTTNGREETGQFLIGVDGQLFSIEADMQVGKPALPYAACGCGFAYALGALHTMTRSGMFLDSSEFKANTMIKNAIGTAIEFSNGCGGSVNVVSTDQA